jgi:hypothetical protein
LSGAVAQWRKSSHSISDGHCVEVRAEPDGMIAVRDSKDRAGPVLRFTREEWEALVRGAQAGEFGHLTSPPHASS